MPLGSKTFLNLIDSNLMLTQKINFSMDNFHFSQALYQLTTKENKDLYYALKDIVKNNDKENFKIICKQFIDLNPARKETIENKMNYP